MLKLTDATPPTTPNSTWLSTKQKPYPNHISQHHRAAIGPMMGKVSPHNPIGISRSQVKKVYALQHSEGASTDSWLTGSIAHASGSTGVTNYPRLLMLRSSSSSSTAASTHTPPEDISDSSDNETDAYGSVVFTPPPANRPARAYPVIRSDLVNISRLVQSYIHTLRPTTFSNRADWTLHVSRSAQLTDKPTVVPIVAIFGRHDRGPSRQMSYARPDIAVGDPELLHVLYRIGQSQYNARVEVPEYFGYWEPNQFMTFSPTGPPYIPPDLQGHMSYHS